MSNTPVIRFISDTHFFHYNVIKMDGRPWDSLEEMHEGMLSKWNSVVSDDDIVYILGDYSWKRGDEDVTFLSQLNSKHKRLVLGNHDARNPSRAFKGLFESISTYEDIKVTLETGEKKRVILSHYFMPFYAGHYYGGIHLHGHSHNTAEHEEELRIAEELNKKGFPNEIYNVGCMLPYMDYAPRTLDEIIERSI